MLGAIIGDIVGSRFEFNNARRADFELFTKESTYTDDTICTVAIADAAMNGWNYADALLDWCRRYPHPKGAYGASFAAWLASEKPRPYYSFGNGAAMRVSSIGWLYGSMLETLEAAKESAEVTHDHPQGIQGAQATAALVFLLRHGGSKEQARELIEKVYGQHIPPYRPFSNPFTEECGATVLTAASCFLSSQNFEDAIRKAILVGGDSDTIGAVTGAFAEAYYGVPELIKKQALARLPDEMLDVIRQFNFQIGREA